MYSDLMSAGPCKQTQLLLKSVLHPLIGDALGHLQRNDAYWTPKVVARIHSRVDDARVFIVLLVRTLEKTHRGYPKDISKRKRRQTLLRRPVGDTLRKWMHDHEVRDRTYVLEVSEIEAKIVVVGEMDNAE
jgi:hypothetical protein